MRKSVLDEDQSTGPRLRGRFAALASRRNIDLASGDVPGADGRRAVNGGITHTPSHDGAPPCLAPSGAAPIFSAH
jgi:hypothetical protein